MAQQSAPYSDMLLGDMHLISTDDVDAWTRAPQPLYTSQHHRHQFGLAACPPAPAPAPLIRYASMPVRQMTAAIFQQQQQQQQKKNYQQQQSALFTMGTPPTLARHHSHNYVSALQPHHHQHQPQQGFPTPLNNASMPPRHVHVNEMQYLLEISMDQQQPLQYPVPTPQRLIKVEVTPSSPSVNVEPIAFTSADHSTKMAVDDLDPIAFGVFSKTSSATAVTKSGSFSVLAQNSGHPIESAFDSLDRLLPEMEQDLMFRLPEQAVAGFDCIKTTGNKSPKGLSTCKVSECDRRVRSKGFCKTHGGGRKCSIEGCKKSSQNGDFCIGHGGGKKCKEDGCAKAAQSHGLCKAHGGGARCKYPCCSKSSQGGGLCRAHGGGKRCQAAGCPKGAQRGNFCATHGGFRNCKIEDCLRTDRGGGYCEVHRRGRLCKVDGCKKLSRNQGMCTMHIREDKQVLIDPLTP
uniref:WRKY19-like zinc finger domain-containing protein n=1 Tax=Hyaloperonospora arabidopsidis (strain Emoy2) TaxID=559515 RepID=M4BHW7_HYAAE